MTNYPYTSSGKLKDFLEGIYERGEPDKITQSYLTKLGFKSNWDRKFIPIMKFIGLLDSGAKPTAVYRDYMNTSIRRSVMASCVKKSYSDLFDLHPDANRKDNETLANFFRSETGLGSDAVNMMVSTFKTLCELADFDSEYTPTSAQQPVQGIEGVQLATRQISSDGKLTVNLNIQLVLPETENVDIYESIFKLLEKYLLKRG